MPLFFKIDRKVVTILIFCLFLLSLNIKSQEYLDTVIDRINTLEAELRQLRGNNKNKKNSNTFSDKVNDTIASHEQRLVEIEEDIRSLNGYVEEMSYKLDQLVQNLNSLKNENGEKEQTLKPSPYQRSEIDEESNIDQETNTIVNADPNIQKNPGMKVLGVIDEEENSTFELNVGKKEKELEKNKKKESEKTIEINEAELKELSKSPSKIYKYAYDMLVIENYIEAENAFKVFIGEHPKDPLTSNAYYWLGETYYVQKKFQLAAISFARGYQNFPKGNKALDQLFKLSLTFINMGKYEDACASFSKLESEFPKAPKRISNRAKDYKKRAKCQN